VWQSEPLLFELQFDPERIIELSDGYSYPREASVFEAGKRIASGDYSRANLEIIFEWKTKGRGRTRVAANSNDEIADALRLAVAAKTDRAAVAVLCGLHGVQIPVASAILTAIDPARFTIIDFRALEALGVRNAILNIDYYLAYLAYCRELASKHGVTLRQLDHALWQWSKRGG